MKIQYASDLHQEFGMNSIYMPDTSKIQARYKQDTSKIQARVWHLLSLPTFFQITCFWFGRKSVDIDFLVSEGLVLLIANISGFPYRRFAGISDNLVLSYTDI